MAGDGAKFRWVDIPAAFEMEIMGMHLLYNVIVCELK